MQKKKITEKVLLWSSYMRNIQYSTIKWWVSDWRCLLLVHQNRRCAYILYIILLLMGELLPSGVELVTFINNLVSDKFKKIGWNILWFCYTRTSITVLYLQHKQLESGTTIITFTHCPFSLHHLATVSETLIYYSHSTIKRPPHCHFDTA